MRVSVSFHDISEPTRPSLREILEKRAQHISRRFPSLQPELARLEGRIEKNPNHHLYRVALRLKLPSGVLSATEEDHDLIAVLSEALDELERQIEKHVARLHSTHLRKRALRSRWTTAETYPQQPQIGG